MNAIENIRRISAVETHVVRHPVLRPDKDLSSCIFDGDELATTVHFGYFQEDMLIGVITILFQPHPDFNEEGAWQIRGMAVLETFRHKNIGTKLLNYTEKYLSRQQAKLIWFNARTAAVPFYTRSGYASEGDVFDIPGVGAHSLMHKWL